VATTRVVRVARDGSVRLPFYPKALTLAGRDASEAESDIAAAYGIAKLIEEPAVVDVIRVEVGDRVKNRGGPIARGDLLAVDVDDLVRPGELGTFTIRVGEQGAAYLPSAGEVAVAGKSEGAAADTVAAALKSTFGCCRGRVGRRFGGCESARAGTCRCRSSGRRPSPARPRRPRARPRPGAAATAAAPC
jgi:protein involved in polysaccharide export with SLBB domain